MKDEGVFGDIRDRSVNTVSVHITLESGCDWREGEYNLTLNGLLGSLDLNTLGGVDDITLIQDAVFDVLEDKIGDRCEGCLELTLQESGEWEGYNWHKYYIVIRSVFHE